MKTKTVINIRVTEAEKAELMRQAKAHGLSMSSWLRMNALLAASEIPQQLRQPEEEKR